MQLRELEERVSGLEGRIGGVESSITSQVRAISETIREQMQQTEQIVSDYFWEVESVDVISQSAILRVSAQPKSYTEGMRVEFTVHSSGEDPVQEAGVLGPGNVFSGSLTIPLSDDIRLSIAISKNGKTENQLLELIPNLKRENVMEEESWLQEMPSELMREREKVAATVVTSISPASQWKEEQARIVYTNWPAKGSVCILKNGRSVASVPIDLSMFDLNEDEVVMEEYEVYTKIVHELKWKKGDVIQLQTVLKDNYGNLIELEPMDYK